MTEARYDAEEYGARIWPWLFLSQFFTRFWAIALDKGVRWCSLLAFELELEQFQGAVMAAADQEAIFFYVQLRVWGGNAGLARFEDLQIFAAEFCVRARPGLEAAQPVQDFMG